MVAVMIGRLWLVAWWANHVVAVVQGMFRITSYVNNGVTPEIVNIFFIYLKVPKRENFSLAFFALSEPTWVCDLESGKKSNFLSNDP